MKTAQELISTSLPKWPQCLIKGEKISETQALEIIRRTDRFLCNIPFKSSHDDFVNWIIDTLSIPYESDFRYQDTETFDNIYKRYKDWSRNFGCINLEYLHNDFVHSAFVGGANGWCNPDGTIEYHYNIGKWPEVYEVFSDLVKIATTWPFLKFTCTLMDNEWCEEHRPLVSFVVGDGFVDIVDPDDIDPIMKESQTPDDLKDVFLNLLEKGYDSAISRETIESWKQFVKI